MDTPLQKHPSLSAAKTVYEVLIVITLTHLLNDMIQSVIPASYPLIKDKFGFSFAQIGIITLVFQFTTSIFQPFVGSYTDRHPKPYSLVFGMCITFIGLIMLATAPNFYIILISVATIGCGSAIFHPGASRVAQMAAWHRKGLAQSIFQVGGEGGNAIGPLVAALIVVPYGLKAIGWFTICAIVAVVLLAWVGKWLSRQLVNGLHWKTESVDLGVRSLPKRKIGFALLLLVVLMFSKNLYINCMANYFTFFLIDRFGISIQASQLCLFVYLFAFAVGIIVGGAVGDRVGRKYVILGSIFGAAPFTVLLPFVSLGWTIALSIVIALVISSAFSSILVYATELVPDKFGMIVGGFYGLSFGLGGIGSVFFGWLADQTSIEFIFRITTILPLLGAIAVFLPNLNGGLKK
ncbi:MFS transporter [uncultured Bacteroides sp.]|uniref:MFS transporter n=1 Tax=uncultured Bacteroides sp. TaxID=162156 RepID=UPI00260C1345|nr:MFS transporter [uncultured Bacteroides sp.]